jgi:long-chain acyl-CoA synthetase
MNTSRVFDLLGNLNREYPERVVFAAKENGEWREYRVSEFYDTVQKLSCGLIREGVKPNDKVALMSENRPEWNFVDFATMQLGAALLPLYPTLSESDLRYIINDAQVKVLFISTVELLEKVQAVQASCPSLEKIFILNDNVSSNYKSWKTLLQAPSDDEVSQLEKWKDAVQPNDLLTLIYTSGTTGNPKGVILTHNNLVSNYTSSNPLIPEGSHRALSFLPLSHIFERMVVYMYLSKAVSIYYAESLEKISDNLKEVKPHMFTTVPRLLEKVYDKIVAKGSELKGIKRVLFFWALNLGLRYEYDGKNGWWYELQLKLANKIIFTKWREALGGEIKAICSGGAALQERLARVFWSAGIPVLQGYGLTETSPVIAVNGIDKGLRYFGTCGPTIPGVEVKIAEDGEILARGPNIMLGYYNREDATREVLDADGWFHTGDIGMLVEDRYLKITDRKKEIFKTAGGKYIAPQIIENKFKESKFIEQMMVIGENRKFPSAIVIPAFAYLKDWCALKGISYESNEKIIQNPLVIARLQREVDALNQQFGHWEQVKKFILLPREFTIDAGELTPKLSMKRKAILEKYQQKIEELYK